MKTASQKAKNVYPITHILVKENCAKKYTDVTFMVSKSNLKELQESVLKLLDESLINLISKDEP